MKFWRDFNQKRQIFIDLIDWIQLTLNDNTISYCLLCLYVADPATFLVSNSVLGPYFPLKTVRFFIYGRTLRKLYFYLINIVNMCGLAKRTFFNNDFKKCCVPLYYLTGCRNRKKNPNRHIKPKSSTYKKRENVFCFYCDLGICCEMFL